ncbi:MAG: hypothetical protein ABEJ72_09350, partial [Candidatus Aenigmatarchaeota archaeon]
YSFMSMSYTGDVMVRNEDGKFNKVGNIDEGRGVVRSAISRVSPCKSCDRFAKFECDAFHNICAKDVKLGMW